MRVVGWREREELYRKRHKGPVVVNGSKGKQKSKEGICNTHT